MSQKLIRLPQPPLLDFTKLKNSDEVRVIIQNTQHKFATDADPSGTDDIKQPIFGHRVYINNKEFSNSSFGLPFIRFGQGSSPIITYENQTLFTFNIHYHGLNTVGGIDGTSMETVIGPSTLLGPKVTFRFPKITNNQSLLWIHTHNMFVSMELIYGGLLGLLEIVDKPTKWLTEDFEYSDNHLLLTAMDMDLSNTGTQTFANLSMDENRSNFAVINGVSVVNWYSDQTVPFVNTLYHESSKNLVKIDILNCSLNWRVFHIGVCDDNHNIKSFYQIQTDSGLINPIELRMAYIPTGSRIAILVDLNQFKHKSVNVFFYNYDLTEVLGSSPTFPNQPNNRSLTAVVPDQVNLNNPTPYPTPIPDPTQQNPQGLYTALNYPTVNSIGQTSQILENGTIPTPNRKIKIFMKMKYKNKHKHKNLSLEEIFSKIRKTIFGMDNYEKYKSLLKTPNFEYDSKFNYLSFLNPDYYYNLPKFDIPSPQRNIIMFFEQNTNSIQGSNPNGTTEYVDDANRIMADLWNSHELDLNWALEQYNKSPNNYQPPILPSSKFTIYKTNDNYSNTTMISNDTLTIQIFNDNIAYGDTKTIPLTTVTVVFPPSNLINLQEWVNLVNTTFSKTLVDINGESNNLNNLITIDWSFFPYALNFSYQKTTYIKSAIIKTKNNSNYCIRFLGRWPLLQFFGKPLVGNTLNPINETTNQSKKIQMDQTQSICSGCCKQNKSKSMVPIKNYSQYIKCDEFSIFGIRDADIQQFFPFYATTDGEIQLPIACMKRGGELIIQSTQTYIGLYDGFLNDNLKSFSTKLKSTEQWIYTNGDDADAHALHFHLTSGYVSPQSNLNSPGLVSEKRLSNQLLYARDIYQVGPQETIAFNVTWPHYPSNQTSKSPILKGIGGVVHCHFMPHTDANSMIIQYFVEY